MCTAGGCKCRQGSICQESESCSWCYVEPGNTCSDTRGSGTGYTGSIISLLILILITRYIWSCQACTGTLRRNTRTRTPRPRQKGEREQFYIFTVLMNLPADCRSRRHEQQCSGDCEWKEGWWEGRGYCDKKGR